MTLGVFTTSIGAGNFQFNPDCTTRVNLPKVRTTPTSSGPTTYIPVNSQITKIPISTGVF